MGTSSCFPKDSRAPDPHLSLCRESGIAMATGSDVIGRDGGAGERERAGNGQGGQGMGTEWSGNGQGEKERAGNGQGKQGMGREWAGSG